MIRAFFAAASALAFLNFTTPVAAEDCLLDTNNDGNADGNVDTDKGANSDGDDERLACGTRAWAMGSGAVALGPDTVNDIDEHGARAAEQATAIGADASALAKGSLAIGYLGLAEGTNAAAIGSAAAAQGLNATSVGRQSNARLNGATAIGYQADAAQVATTVIGYQASATANSAVAIGRGALAGHQDAVAIGRDAATTAANQVTLGGTGSSVRIGDMAASTAAQVGPVDVVTVDANGTIGRGAAASAAQVDRIAAVTDAQFASLDGRVGLLENDIQRLESGIAASMALGSAIAMPDQPLVLSVNAATYGGEGGFAGSITGRLNDRLAVGGGIAASTGDSRIGAQVGVSIGL